MAPQGVSGGGGGGGVDKDGIDERSAKHLLDSIGKKVHDEVEKDAKTYEGELKGELQEAASTIPELVEFSDTCKLVQEYYNHPNGGDAGGGKGERYPCKKLSGEMGVNRFSDKIGGQCTNEKMRSDGKGACAPFRRLHLCDHNLEKMGTTKIDNTHKLLLEVCMAAKYEGNSIETYYTPYQRTNEDSASQLCTVLARSFADIGDIVRGRDLFHGNPQEKEKRDELEKNLKTIFEKIHSGLTTTKTKTKKSAKDHYKDENDPNFFKLREDWWTANRHTVWEALTCDVKSGNNYFRPTCSDSGDGKGQYQANNKCTCNNGDVPTYFDYVPQFLRWFEEWAEDFCRLRKRKLEDAKEQCRPVKNGEHKYCDLNRYDCTKTASGEKKFVEDDVCKGCQYSCAHFVKWIDNQKLEFLKQKQKYKKEMEKYTKEITRGGGRKKRGAGSSGDSSNYDGYENKFYNKLKKKKK
ncbi:hypothetical protein PFBG_04124 [Plasmodium falciparum 7G8]|uniref:Uncharacterized protein n=1 Tax=Plasmodium falciparum (isolate 7G8) TaxID=57266 RepID=W7FHW6_PLAF8|nr:hypothetical protein PFBG_04124 [Plasmodium falciparum 7G8]